MSDPDWYEPTPVLIKKGDKIEITILSIDKSKDKGDGYDRYEILGIVAEKLGKEIEE